MNVTFYDDPLQEPHSRQDVKIKQLGLYIYPDRRRLVVGFALTPFRERPSLEVKILNAHGRPAGSTNLIQTMTPNFSLTMHLRDQEPTDTYELTAVLYYASAEEGRQDVFTKTVTFDATEEGEQIFN